MPAAKKCKIYGLSSLELERAVTQLRKLRSSFLVEELPESDPMPDDTLVDEIDSLVGKLELRLDDPIISLSFSAADDKVLERFNVIRKGMLHLQPKAKLREAIAASQGIGADKLWSNDHMYKHLSFLVNSFTAKNETSSRMVIDTFFFRTTAMVPPSLKVVVMLEHPVPAVPPMKSRMDTISGIIDYTAIVAQLTVANNFVHIPPTLNERYGRQMIAFLATEAKASGIVMPLEARLPQLLLELIACAKHLG